MTQFLALAVLVLSALFPASAQSPAPATASIAGSVTKEPGSEPLKKVLVQVIAEDQKQGGNYTASTDADGHFNIENIVPGRYRIFFERTGFVEVDDHGLKAEVNVITIQPGQSIADLLFRMLPTAVVSGRITDEDGDPLPEVRVMAQKIGGPGTKPGRSKREIVASAGTNDLGEYRLSGLFPGQYFIVAIPAPDFRDYEPQPRPTTTAKNDTGPTDSQPETRYLTTYYPGTYDAAQASSLTLKAGDEMPVNLTLVPARTYQVRGIIVQGVIADIPTGQAITAELTSKAGDSIRAAEVGPNGEFELRGVGPGSYVLKATGGSDAHSLTARQDVNVVAGDVEGVRLVLQPSFVLSGHLSVEGNAGDLAQYAVNLRQAELPDGAGFFMSPDFFGTNAPVDRLGHFEWKNVNPGNYIVQLFGGNAQNNFYLKSVILGGRDVDTGFTVNGPATLNLVVSTKAGMIEGTVVDSSNDSADTAASKSLTNDHPIANATVVAVPEEKYREVPNRFASGSTDQNGSFVIHGLAPGSYTVYAWRQLEESLWRDPDFLKSQTANGTTVRVDENSSQKLQLKLSSTPEDSP